MFNIITNRKLPVIRKKSLQPAHDHSSHSSSSINNNDNTISGDNHMPREAPNLHPIEEAPR